MNTSVYLRNLLNEYLEAKSKQKDDKMNENKEELKNWFEQKFIQPETPQDTHLSIDDFFDTLQENSITA